MKRVERKMGVTRVDRSWRSLSDSSSSSSPTPSSSSSTITRCSRRSRSPRCSFLFLPLQLFESSMSPTRHRSEFRRSLSSLGLSSTPFVSSIQFSLFLLYFLLPQFFLRFFLGCFLSFCLTSNLSFSSPSIRSPLSSSKRASPTSERSSPSSRTTSTSTPPERVQRSHFRTRQSIVVSPEFADFWDVRRITRESLCVGFSCSSVVDRWRSTGGRRARTTRSLCGRSGTGVRGEGGLLSRS